MSNELESRIEALERQLSEIKKLNGIPGPQGKPGNIAAAVLNAEQVVENKLAEYVKRADGLAKGAEDLVHSETLNLKKSIDSLRGELHQHSEQVAQSFSAEGTKNRIEKLVVQVLHDYGVVSSHDNRVIQAN
jgi:uncharacterized coiled-coil DUF342 family protein